MDDWVVRRAWTEAERNRLCEFQAETYRTSVFSATPPSGPVEGATMLGLYRGHSDEVVGSLSLVPLTPGRLECAPFAQHVADLPIGSRYLDDRLRAGERIAEASRLAVAPGASVRLFVETALDVGFGECGFDSGIAAVQRHHVAPYTRLGFRRLPFVESFRSTIARVDLTLVEIRPYWLRSRRSPVRVAVAGR